VNYLPVFIHRERFRTPTAGAPKWEKFAFCAAFALLGACAVAPIWETRFLPTLDEPNHLSAIYIWRSLSDPLSPLHSFYKESFAPVSYLLHYGLAYLFATVLGVEAAHKLTLTLYVLALPSAAYLWCRRTRRTGWLCLTTLPLAFSASWAYGYHPFNLGMAAFLFGVVAYDRLLGKPGPSAWFYAMLASLACYFGHPFPLALLLVCAALLWLLRGPRLRSAALVSSAFSPSCLLVIWQVKAASLNASAPARALGEELLVVNRRLWFDRVLDLPQYAVNPLSSAYDSKLFVALVAMVAAIWLIQTIRRAEPLRSAFIAHRALWLALGLFALYLVMPEHLNEPVYMWIARGRIAPAIGFFFLLSCPLRPGSTARWVALAAALAATPLYFEMGVQYRDFGRFMNGMENVLDACPAQAQVLTIRLGNQNFPGIDVPVLRELSSWVQVVHGGYSPLRFERPIAFPFTVIRTLPAPDWRQHDYFWPYLLSRKFGCALFLGYFGDLPGKSWSLARTEGLWKLYLSTQYRR
jgi:hypothetical protein